MSIETNVPIIIETVETTFQIEDTNDILNFTFSEETFDFQNEDVIFEIVNPENVFEFSLNEEPLSFIIDTNEEVFNFEFDEVHVITKTIETQNQVEVESIPFRTLYDEIEDEIYFKGISSSSSNLTNEPIWRIQKISVNEVTKDFSIQYPDGENISNKSWDLRETYTYS